MSVPTQQKALFLESARGDWVVRSTDVPQPAAGQVLVRIESSGLNPVDWKIHDHDFAVASYPTILGFEGAGVIVKLGKGVTNVSIGDKVLVVLFSKLVAILSDLVSPYQADASRGAEYSDQHFPAVCRCVR